MFPNQLLHLAFKHIVNGFPSILGRILARYDASHEDRSRLSTDQPIDLDELRPRLMKMSDAALRRFGEASKFMCSPRANLGEPPRDVFVVQLRESRAEWRRRHPAPGPW